MKKLTYILFISFTINSVYSQWQSDVRLSSNPASLSWNNAWCVASSGNVVHVVWQDDVNLEIYYKRSTDGGISWGSDTRLTNNSSPSYSPSLGVSGLIVNVVWRDSRAGYWDLFYKRSSDGGISWGEDTQLTNHPAFAENQSITISGLIVHVVWDDNRDGNQNYGIYYKRSTDGGMSWKADRRLTNFNATSQFPSIAVSGSNVHVVWRDGRDGNYEEYYKRSTDGGISWGADTRLTNDPAYSGFPSVTVSGLFVHVLWSDSRDGNSEIYYKHSTDGGISWSADSRLTNDPGISGNPNIAISGQIVHVVWRDDRDGNDEIYYKLSTNGGISWASDIRLTNNTAYSWYPSVSVSGSVVHVVWQDNRDGNFVIYYKCNPTGNLTGIININPEIPKTYSLSQNYPNPFNPSTKIKFDIPPVGNGRDRSTQLSVYDILGKQVATLVNESLKPGTYEVDWNANNFPSGVYYYKLVVGDNTNNGGSDFVETKKMVLIK